MISFINLIQLFNPTVQVRKDKHAEDHQPKVVTKTDFYLHSEE